MKHEVRVQGRVKGKDALLDRLKEIGADPALDRLDVAAAYVTVSGEGLSSKR